jgi:hypothetical protein
VTKSKSAFGPQIQAANERDAFQPDLLKTRKCLISTKNSMTTTKPTIVSHRKTRPSPHKNVIELGSAEIRVYASNGRTIEGGQ